MTRADTDFPDLPTEPQARMAALEAQLAASLARERDLEAERAVLREVLATGPRHEDASLRNPLFHAAGAAGGAAAASALTQDWARAMGRGRRVAFLALSGALGAALPFALAATGPGVRRRLSALVPAAAEGGARAAQ